MKKIAVILLDVNTMSQAAHHVQTALEEAKTKYKIFSAADVTKLVTGNYDALVVVDDLPDAAAILEAFHSSSKPIGAFDQAIAMTAEILGNHGVTLAIDSTGSATAITKTGAYIEKCKLDDFVSDRENKIVSTLSDPAGIRRALEELLEMA